MSSIVWLASYPKSGNTWFRIFLNALLNQEDPLDINQLNRTPIASARSLFEEAVGLDAADLTHEETDRLRPEVYAHIAATSPDDIYLKIHDAFTCLHSGQPLFSGRGISGALYFIRNPLDVAVSYANHCGISIDKSVEAINNPDHALCASTSGQQNQLRQILLDWSGHVTSWIANPHIPVHPVRYEDMKQAPAETFGRAVEFTGIFASAREVEAALEKSAFDELKRQEKEKGFKEKAMNCPSFFNRGEVGYWREHLSAAQADRIISRHGSTMARFGYLDAEGRPIF